MEKRVIQSREDIELLVEKFYTEIRKDSLLSPIFNTLIKRDDLWEHHFQRLSDFWESNLLRAQKYQGAPDAIHFWVDMQVNYIIEQKHFTQWLRLWEQTLNKYFIGEVAERARSRAKNMARAFHQKVMEVKPPHKKPKKISS